MWNNQKLPKTWANIQGVNAAKTISWEAWNFLTYWSHFPDGIFKCIYLFANVSISIKISLKSVANFPINNIPALVQIMAWRRPGVKPFSEPMTDSLLTHICVTQSQWVSWGGSQCTCLFAGHDWCHLGYCWPPGCSGQRTSLWLCFLCQLDGDGVFSGQAWEGFGLQRMECLRTLYFPISRSLIVYNIHPPGNMDAYPMLIIISVTGWKEGATAKYRQHLK